MSFCIQCGEPLKEGAHFCPACGAKADRTNTPAVTSTTPDRPASAPRAVRPYWIAGAAGCAGILALGVIIFSLLYWVGSRKKPTRTSTPSIVTPSAPPSTGTAEILFREVAHPDYKLFYEIPSDWEETGAKGLYQATPPSTHPDARQVWARVQSVPKGQQKAEDAVAKALGKWLEALPGLEIDSTFPMLTRPGGEVVRDANSVGKDEILIFSTIVHLRFTEPASGKRWRAIFAASHQADGRSSHTYLTGIASVEDRWEDFSPVFLRLLAGTKVVLKPK